RLLPMKEAPMVNLLVAEPSKNVLDGLRMIDCDAHFTEPSDLWTSRAPSSMRDRVRVHKTVDGQTAWFLDGRPWASVGGNTLRADGSKVLGSYAVHPFSAIHEGAWSTGERLRLMDDMGVWAQVLYPNGVGFS